MNFEEISFGSPDYDEELKLRYDILRKPLGLEFTEEQIAEEYDQKHFVIRKNSGEIVGCLVLKIIDQHTIKMRQVAVQEECQRLGVGKLLVQGAEQWSMQFKFNKLTLHARDIAVPFYLKLGYQKVGSEFVEVGIPHWEMEKLLN